MPEPPDVTIRSAATGDDHAWRRLIDAYSGRVYGLVYRQCGDGELAEEITQATFVKVLDKLGDYQERGRFEAWLFRIAVNQLRDEMRRRKRQATAVDFSATPPASLGHIPEQPTPLQLQERREQMETLRAMVQRLPEPDRELLHLRYAAQLSFAQIAEALDQPLGTVRARGHRALKKLRQMLDHEEQGGNEGARGGVDADLDKP